MVVKAIVRFVSPYAVLLNLLIRSLRTMPAVLKDGYKGYRSAGTRADEAIQCNDWVSNSVVLYPVLMLRQQVEQSIQIYRAIFRRRKGVV